MSEIELTSSSLE